MSKKNQCHLETLHSDHLGKDGNNVKSEGRKLKKKKKKKRKKKPSLILTTSVT